jgi:hypothetical protein
MVNAAPTVSSFDFGTRPVASAYNQTIAIPVDSSLNGQVLNTTLTYGIEFTAGTGCLVVSGSCSLAVSFTPKYVGLRQDGVRLADSQGNLITTAFLHGVGDGAQMVFSPGVISLKTAHVPQSPNYNSIVVDPTGAAYFAEDYGVYKLSPGATQPVLYAGHSTFSSGTSGDGGPAVGANVFPGAIALDGAGNLFIEEEQDIRKVDHSTGIINTVISGLYSEGIVGHIRISCIRLRLI